jgi:predicted aldo/keto reductase-like oxidoreductase
MHHRTLGKTGLTVSILGIGSSPFRYGKPEVCAQLLEQAVELGITYYDTARSYVNGEEAVAHLAPHIKDQLVIATKTGARGGKYCLQDLQRSLNTMKRDRIDMWMTHMIQTEHEYELCTDLGGFCDIAAAARQAGLVRATGVSFHAPTHLILRAIEEHAFDVVMFPFNLIGRETIFGSSIASYRETLLPAARANGIGVVVMKVLAGGELRHGAPRLDFVADAVAARGVVEGAVRYAVMHPDITTAVVGMASTDELVRNVMAVEGIDDTHFPQFVEWTHRVAEIDRGECTRCGSCVGICPEGIEIPKIFRLYDQLRFFGMDGVARYKYSTMEIDASACVRCRKCQEVCPEEFDIGASLEAAHVTLASQRQAISEGSGL